MKRRRKGVISLFAAVSLTIVVSMLLGLLEGARMNYSYAICEQQTEYVMQSFFGQYNVELLKNYNIYGIDERLFEQREDVLTQMMDFQTGHGGISLLNPSGGQMDELKYRLMTDDGGLDFRQQAAELYLPDLSKTEMEQIRENVEQTEQLGGKEKETVLMDKMEESLGGLEENPVKSLQQKKNSFVLSMVLPKGYEVSSSTLGKAIRLEDQLLSRGNMAGKKESAIREKIGFSLYLRNYFSDALSEKKAPESSEKNGVLQYQLEYLIVGKHSDMENLEGVVKRLILTRELTWFTYLFADTSSRTKAHTLALTFTSGAEVPGVTEAIVMAIILIWSYENALDDVKQLMEGEKISLLLRKKGDVQDAGETRGMFSYMDYLMLFLLMGNTDTITYRALDVIEVSLKTSETSFDAAKTITGIEGRMSYQIDAKFSNIFLGTENYFPQTKTCEFRTAYHF